MTKERFIAGIYNYCDYWCERCAFTQRCRNFASGRVERRQSKSGGVESPSNTDATNAAFWNDLAERLRETTIFGKHESDDVPQDDFVADDGPDDAWSAREEMRRKELECHPLVIMSRDYMMRVNAWLKTADGDLKAVARGLMEDAGNRFSTGDVEEQAREIGEMIEVVVWYHTLISAKLGRAVHGLLEHDDFEGDYAAIIAASLNSDADGSGKVALVAIERSIAAWLKLRDILPAQEYTLLSMLALLDQMRRRLQIDLPDSVTFRRPGFDGEDVGLFD
ncbi:MAG: hypothetical protein LC725_09320 [Lentisphaerae bacterium]|nr:hypothetical protein [Lentisphaerota bacterium]